MRKRVTLASFLTFGCVLLGLGAANFFPDQTWRALTIPRTLYDRILWRTTSMPSSADRQLKDPGDQPCYAHVSDEVEQISANPQAFAHRIVTIQGQYFSGFEISLLHTCGNGHNLDLWMEDASVVAVLARLNDWGGPTLRFKFDEQRNAAAWRKLRSQEGGDARPWCSDVTVVGQFETNTPKKGGFGHLGAYEHELILLNVLSLSRKKCEIRGS